MKNWVIDFAGPLGQANDKYILVCVCTFSCFAVLIETDDCSATTTARALFDRVIRSFGIPENIFSDRGTYFDNQVIKNLNSSLGINWQLSSSNNPRSHGTAERLISHMKESLNLLEFDLSQLPLIQLYHNSSLIGDSALSPHEIIFGIRANTSALVEHVPLELSSDDISMLIIETRITWESLKRYMRDRQSDIYSIKATQVQFLPGDEVYRIYVTSSAFKRTVRSGPFKVLAKSGRNTYLLEGFKYPIPEYQLHPAVIRPDDLSVTPEIPDSSTDNHNSTDNLNSIKPGQLIIFETYEHFDGPIVSFDVGEVVETIPHLDRVKILRYYYQDDGKWLKWPYDDEDEPIDIPMSSIIRCGISLDKNNKLPKQIIKQLSTISIN